MIDNTEDIIDSRDVIERLSELVEAEENGELDDEEGEVYELRALRALAKQGETFADWEDGVVLVRDSYFKDYAEEFADDIGALGSDVKWPRNHIDWDAAARELRQDYTAVEFDGVTYWGRA